jgi:chromosome segregation ATPase
MSIVLVFLAKHWRETTIAVLLFVVTFFWWQDHRLLLSAYDASVESYETRIKELNESYQREIDRKQEALQEYEEKLYILEAEYMDFRGNLDRLKDERVEEFVTLRRDNPAELINQIEQQFGFEYVE